MISGETINLNTNTSFYFILFYLSAKINLIENLKITHKRGNQKVLD